MINALSIDLEYWHSAQLVKNSIGDDPEDLIWEMTSPILKILDSHHIRATFFVLGELANKYPDIIERIYIEGHEIASHLYSHKNLHELGPIKFEKELKLSKNLLKSITHEDPIGFRAPTFSIDDSTKWAFLILKKYNFKYDSSIFPCNSGMYGVNNAPITIYHPSMKDITQHDSNEDLIEFPMTVFCDNLRIPISGGFYFRFFPSWCNKKMIRMVNNTRPANIYVHPWELFNEVPRVNLNFPSNFITYHGIKNAKKKFDSLLRSFQFAPLRDVIDI